MSAEYVTGLLSGFLLGLAGYVVAFAGWALAFWWANHPGFPFS